MKDTDQAKELNDIFDRYNVTMIFASHIHMYYRGVWQKTPYIITGGAGAPLKNFQNYGFYHYIVVTIDDKNINYDVRRIHIEKPSEWYHYYLRLKDILGL